MYRGMRAYIYRGVYLSGYMGIGANMGIGIYR